MIRELDGLFLNGNRWSEGWWIDEDGYFHPSFKQGIDWAIVWNGETVIQGVMGEDGWSGQIPNKPVYLRN